MPQSKPSLVLVILDGWGHSDNAEGNAIAACPTDVMRRLAARYPATLLDASAGAVGLPDRVMGNSEVGHLTIGAGQIVDQDLTLINKTLQQDLLDGNSVLADCFNGAAADGATVHFMGLASDAGVHSHLDHLEALVNLAVARQVSRIRVHAFTDGRDTPPDSGKGYLERMESFLAGVGGDAAVATVSGRYYAMDRDQRWERVEKAWQALVLGEGETAESGAAAVDAAYDRGETDEFILPTVIAGVAGGRIATGDRVVFFNFRPDRAREMTRALTQGDFDGFVRPQRPRLGGYVCLTRYDESLDLPVAFAPRKPGMTLGRLFSERGTTQIRIAETEKYAHVTYFLNGGIEGTYPGEERILVPSSRVATYDLQPEMRAKELTERTLQKIQAGDTDIIVLNFANADMVGHTGVYEATLAACEVVDRAVGRLAKACLARGSLLAVTADHGNAEQMLQPGSQQPHTAHTTNQVPLILVREDLVGARLKSGGGLSSVASTVLIAAGISPPAEMENRSLL